MQVVINRYNESLYWTTLLSYELVVYNKGNANAIQTVIQRPNVGREAETILHHIIQGYNCLSDTTAFLQGNPFDHCQDVVQLLNDNQNTDSVVWLGSNWGPVTKHYDGGPGHKRYLPLIEISHKLFHNCIFDINTKFTFSAGAQYIVPKKFIVSKSLAWWQQCYTIFMSDLDTSPWAFERLWPHIWLYQTV